MGPTRLGVGVHEDLHVVLVVVDELVEALVNQFLKLDATGDELRQVQLAFLNELDRCWVVVRVTDRSTQVDFLENQVWHVDFWLATPNGHVHDHAAGLNSIDEHVQYNRY